MPETFRQDVKVTLQHAGNWKADPDLVMDTVVAEAKEWRMIEAFSQSCTSTPPSRQKDSTSRQHGSNFGRFLGEVGVPSVWPGRSYYAQLHGAIPSGIRWGAGAFFCSAPAAPSAQGKQPGSSWCWRGGIFRGYRIFAVHVCSAASPGFKEQSRVFRIGVGWSGFTTDCAG